MLLASYGPDVRGRLEHVLGATVDPHVGVVSFVSEVRRDSGAPALFHYAAEAANTAALGEQENFRHTGGAGTNRWVAMAKAVGEAIERYCAAFADYSALPVTSADHAPFRCVSPDSFALYSGRQYREPEFPWHPFGIDTPVRWVRATELATGAEAAVPACRCFMPYIYRLDDGDTPIDQPISTGLACHMSHEEAALGALCEVVERDAVTIVWQAMVAPPRLSVGTLSESNRDLVRRFEQVGDDVCVFDVTLDHGITTILSVLRGRDPATPALVVAGACDPDPEAAVRKSLEELAHTRRYCSIIKRHMDRIEPEPGHCNVTDQADHLNFWSDERNLSHAEWLFSSEDRVDFNSLPVMIEDDSHAALEAVARRIASVGEQAWAVNLTTPDVAELGFAVVRVVVPGFHPLHLGYTMRALGGYRLWEVPQRCGYPGIEPESGDNPWPHPYP